MDARKYMKSSFIKKQDLQRDGPRPLTVAAVEEGVGFDSKNGAPPPTELQLVFTDGSRLSLRTEANLRRMFSWFGHDTEQWVGQTIEVYFSPDVTNPRGGEPGGIRLQRPSKRSAETFVSDLEDGDVPTDADEPFTGKA
jgi:hypothetical protein